MTTLTEDPAAQAEVAAANQVTAPEPAPPAGDPQDGLFDRTVDDSNLEALLDQREDLKRARKEAQAAFKETDDAVKARIAEFDLPDGEVARCGKYRIEKKATKPRSVAFETEGSSRLDIKLFED